MPNRVLEVARLTDVRDPEVSAPLFSFRKQNRAEFSVDILNLGNSEYTVFTRRSEETTDAQLLPEHKQVSTVQFRPLPSLANFPVGNFL